LIRAGPDPTLPADRPVTRSHRVGIVAGGFAPRAIALGLLVAALVSTESASGDPAQTTSAQTTSAQTTSAQPQTTSSEPTDYVTRRLEPAGFPLIGGDSDIGFEFGGVATASYFSDGVKPYRWDMDLLLAWSIKQGPSGAELAQQNYLWNWDVPGLYGGRLRLNPEVSYAHTINYGYFGLGNASSGITPSSSSNPGRYHEWIESIAQVRTMAKIALQGPIAALVAVQYLYVNPTIYQGSLLQSDAVQSTSGGPVIYGTSALSLPSLAAGFSYDTRDDEVFPHSGMFHEAGARIEQGFPTSAGVRYVETGAILRGYVPLPAGLVMAGRLVLNAQVGDVPFYDLFQAGPFDQKEMPGGSAGVRGVPVGRYLGPVKVVGNVELRSLWLHFSAFHQRFSIGNDVFFDAGRVWSDYTFRSPLDGSGLGIKYGVGGGVYLLWGQAAMLRIEAAYSPDAVSENPSLPLGIYAEDNVMF
jgi:hypothetical protein